MAWARVLFATFCATSATASFMAANFHELSPYVLIGNPLTLAIIEFFAVPAALLGARALSVRPRCAGLVVSRHRHRLHHRGRALDRGGAGLDGLPAGIRALGAAVPVARGVVGRHLAHAALARDGDSLRAHRADRRRHGPTWDVAIQATGESAVVRDGDGKLVALGRVAGFTTEQWLRADADGRDPHAARAARCATASGCTAALPDGRTIALVKDPDAFVEDCSRAKVLITPLYAPSGCAAPLVIDRRKLETTGAITLRFDGERPFCAPRARPAKIARGRRRRARGRIARRRRTSMRGTQTKRRRCWTVWIEIDHAEQSASSPTSQSRAKPWIEMRSSQGSKAGPAPACGARG